MNNDELYLARIMFKNKILESDGQTFEKLFVRVMQNYNPNFIPVKPQGQFGDRKNDGFDKKNGVYYQVYAPEDIRLKEKETINKLAKDFTGLYSFWNNNSTPIKEFYYVTNDKYKGVYPSLFPELEKIKKKYYVETNPFLSKNLEDLFLTLADEKIADVIGPVLNPSNINDVEYDIMNEVINYLLEISFPFDPEKIPNNPNFEEKIKFNDLSKPIYDFLNAGRLQEYIIRDYFDLNSNFTKDELRKKFNGLYIEAKNKIDDSEKKNDKIFMFIFKKASPNSTPPIQSAVLVLMSYYFEYCDIFESINKNNQSSFWE